MKKNSKRKALAFNWDRCCHLAICLQLEGLSSKYYPGPMLLNFRVLMYPTWYNKPWKVTIYFFYLELPWYWEYLGTLLSTLLRVPYWEYLTESTLLRVPYWEYFLILPGTRRSWGCLRKYHSVPRQVWRHKVRTQTWHKPGLNIIKLFTNVLYKRS